jgi:hypothetical protein
MLKSDKRSSKQRGSMDLKRSMNDDNEESLDYQDGVVMMGGGGDENNGGAWSDRRIPIIGFEEELM